MAAAQHHEVILTAQLAFVELPLPGMVPSVPEQVNCGTLVGACDQVLF